MERSVATVVICVLVAGGFSQGAGQETPPKPPRGASCVILRSIKPDVKPKGAAEHPVAVKYGLNYEDLERIRTTVPTIQTVVPMRELVKQIRYREQSREGPVVATTHDYAAFAGLEVERGRFLTEADNTEFENCVVLGWGVARRLFPDADPISQAIKIGTDYYTVVGVLKERPKHEREPVIKASNLNVYIPLNTGRLRFGERIINGRGEDRQVEETQLSEIVVRLQDDARADEATKLIKSMIEPFHPKRDVEISIGEKEL